MSEFLSTRCLAAEGEKEATCEKGCLNVITAFVDHISQRESENFRSRKEDNSNSVTLTTIHQVVIFSVAHNHLFFYLCMVFSMAQ